MSSPAPNAVMISTAAVAPWPDWIMSYQRRPVGSARSSGLAGKQIREEAHVVGMVGDDEEIERPRQLGELAGGRRDLLAFGEAVGVARPEARAEGAGVEGEQGVEMRVAEERPGREVAPGPGRIGPLVGIEPLGRRLVEGADVGDDALLCESRRQSRAAAAAVAGKKATGAVRSWGPPVHSILSLPCRNDRLDSASLVFLHRHHRKVAPTRSITQNDAMIPIA